MEEKYTSPFATANTDAADVQALIQQGLEHMKPNGDIDWANLDTPIGYSRGWLIVRRAYLEQNHKAALVTLPKGDDDATAYKRHQIVVEMRDGQQLSWGEIAVRLGVPESRVRAMYRHNGIKKDLGLRIGKGGRYAYDDPTLYRDNRKREGAHIPLEKKGRPRVEELLNFVQQSEQQQDRRRAKAKATGTKQEQATADAKARAAAARKVAAMRRLLNDKATPDAQKPSIQAKIDELVAKYNLAA